jgi:hypothetical protein
MINSCTNRKKNCPNTPMKVKIAEFKAPFSVTWNNRMISKDDGLLLIN